MCQNPAFALTNWSRSRELSLLGGSDGCFKQFDERIRSVPEAREFYRTPDIVLNELDSNSWSYLKAKALPYTRHLNHRQQRGRGCEQLFSILNEAKAYRHLKLLGTKSLRFIPEMNGRRTPDLEGTLNERKLLCEVKTLNISDDEIATRATPTARSIDVNLSDGFVRKLRSTLENAMAQLRTGTESDEIDRRVYLCIQFDDFLGEYKEEYFAAIDQELIHRPIGDFRLTICNDKTAFYKPLAMTKAYVDNLGGLR